MRYGRLEYRTLPAGFGFCSWTIPSLGYCRLWCTRSTVDSSFELFRVLAELISFYLVQKSQLKFRIGRHFQIFLFELYIFQFRGENFLSFGSSRSKYFFFFVFQLKIGQFLSKANFFLFCSKKSIFVEILAF